MRLIHRKLIPAFRPFSSQATGGRLDVEAAKQRKLFDEVLSSETAVITLASRAPHNLRSYSCRRFTCPRPNLRSVQKSGRVLSQFARKSLVG
ncbi:hypothetical protein PoB_005630200 [Plakobranchus ocellatus]|uniref:Uncharacterized protein n=1 Tax=Plakobranchus ocellatus TaxID=259542 RepID=A0AAV4CEL8_9GAST|nr:hypothetical protein PoB_005630200 [Plakobranchus ocellatus]